MMWTNILTIECLITIHEQWCTHFVQELQGFEPSDRDDVFIFYASALRALVAGAWTERKKIFHGGSFLKLADDDV